MQMRLTDCFERTGPSELDGVPVADAVASRKFLCRLFFTGKKKPTDEETTTSFSLRCIAFREMANRCGYMSPYASTIMHFVVKYDKPRSAKEELVLCGSASNSPVAFRAVFQAWERKDRRLIHYLGQFNITIEQILYKNVHQPGFYVAAFVHTCQCYLVRPDTGPYQRAQPAHCFPGLDKDTKVVDRNDHEWLDHAGVYAVRTPEYMADQMDKFRDGVCQMQSGNFFQMNSSDLPYAVGGHISRMNFKALVVMTGLHLAAQGEEEREDYDEFEIFAVQEAKNACANAGSNYAKKFPEVCPIPAGEVEVKGTWERAFKACSERMFSDLKLRDAEAGTEKDDHEYDDMLDRESDPENTLCAVFRSNERSDVHFVGEDLFNITGVLGKVKMWDTDDWMPFREYEQRLEELYLSDRAELASRRAGLGW